MRSTKSASGNIWTICISASRHLRRLLNREFLGVEGLRLRIRSIVATKSDANLSATRVSYFLTPPKSASRDAFTLIEVLVVVAIISILAGLSMVGLQRARRYGNEQAVEVDLQMLGARLQAFRNATGDFPPTSLSDVKIKGNGINDGNESLFAFLATRKYGGAFAEDLLEDRWSNLDDDSVRDADMKTLKKKIDWQWGDSSKLLEYVDMWGNPYIYIHSRDYQKSFRYQDSEGLIFSVQAQKNPTTGTYYAPTTFQLWSLGPDGVNENGNGDDIVSWK